MAATGVVDGGSGGSCDLATTWRVDAGSLKKNVIFESFLEDSAVDVPSPDSFDEAATYLVLKPEGDDSEPCEIKIRFVQKHEIRQIYVRSTARDYEVYYAQSWKGDSEYLCTVHCSIAERDGQVLRAFDIEETVESTGNSSTESKEEKIAAEGNSGTCEDDWVEVKVLDSSLQHRINYLSNKKSSSRGRDVQDFYEATAEISDLDPCASITLRFLSLQNKSCVRVDEVYVFANAVSGIDSEDQSQDKGSAGSSLMAMLVPTLLQLSKSGMSQIQRQQASSMTNQKGNTTANLTKAADLTDIVSHQDEKGSGDQECEKLQTIDGSMTEPAEKRLCNQILDGGKSEDPLEKNDPPYGHIEKVLEQLVSRVGRIEEVCLRLEKNMLQPLNSIEMRIQQVEQQLEILVNNSQPPGLPPCTRVSAPSFSCTSSSSSFHDEGVDHQPCCVPEPEQKEVTSADLSNASNGISSSANIPYLLPSLVVTAPDFSCEDDLDDYGLKSLKISPQENKKKSLVDDVLAASLSRFLTASTGNHSDCKRAPSCSHGTSKTIINKVPSEKVQALAGGVGITNNINAEEEPSRYTQVLTVVAPDFTTEENVCEDHLNYDKVACVAVPKSASKSQSSNDVTLKGTGNGPSVVTSDLPDMNRNRLMSDQASLPNTVGSAVIAEANGIIPNDVLGVASAERHAPEGSNTCSFRVTNIDDKDDEAEDSISIDVCQAIRGSDQREPATSLLPEKNDEFDQFPGDKTDGSPISVRTVGTGAECVAPEVPDREIQRSLSESSSASLVDYGIPILDVKFTAHEDSGTQLPLEALLDDAIDLNVEADPPKENGAEDAYAWEINFIDINEEDETGDSLTDKSLVTGLGVYDMNRSSTGENDLNDSYSTWKQDTAVSLI